MKQSQLFTKTKKHAPKDEVSKNAQLLIRAGYIHKEMAGVYDFLPLGVRVMEKIKSIIREEMNAVGGQEIELTALQSKEKWEKTGRWDDTVIDNWFKTKLANKTTLGLASTHEEPITEMMSQFISSYKDLPQYAYQFQTKFRNELRAKAGLMRGREFLMKDLYSFSRNKQEHEIFYEKMKEVYMRVFNRLGIGAQTYITISSGGSFSKYSYEFQTISDAGEDTIFIIDEDKRIAINKDDFNDEVIKDFRLENVDKDNLRSEKAVEVGDIYSLGEKYSEALGLAYTDEAGVKKNVYMGCYGIGVPRLMGVLVEIFADEDGLAWPESVAPFRVHLIDVKSQKSKVESEAERIYDELTKKGIDVLWDDRDVRPGEKFADSDLIGIPWRVVVSARSLEAGGVEVKKRSEKEGEIMSVEEFTAQFN